MGRKALLLVAALVGVGVYGCAPPPQAPPPPPVALPVEWCAPHPPSSAAAYQAALDAVYDARVGRWVANDGGVPFTLPDGRVLWMFGDTLLDGGGMASNGFLIQTGACFRPITEPLPDPAPGHFYWPTSAVVEDGQLHVVAYRATGGAAFVFVQMDVLTYSLPGLTLVSSQPLALPNDPGYGEVVATPDGVYAFAGLRPPSSVTAVQLPFERHIARAPSVFGPWAYWDGVGWNLDPATSAPLLWDDGVDAMPSPWEGPRYGGLNVQPHAGGYMATSFPLTPFSKDVIQQWNAPSPVGPWSLVGTVVDIRATVALDDQQLAYGGHVITELPGSPIAVWSINHRDGDMIRLNPDLYKVLLAPATLA